MALDRYVVILFMVYSAYCETYAQFNPALSNTAVLRGQAAAFTCGATKSALGTSVYWVKCSLASSCPALGADADIDPGYAAAQPARAARYNLTATSVDKQYQWRIWNTAEEDKGTYQCRHAVNSLEISGAELIVLGSHPSYTRNTTNSGNQAVEGDIIKFSTEVSYWGRWGPITRWTGPGLGPVINVSIPGVAKHSVSVVISRSLEGETWTAVTAFDTPSDLSPGEADNAPDYMHTYVYPALTVDYGPTVPTFSPSGPYYPGQEVTCAADGKPTPTFRWIDLNTTATVASGSVLLVITDFLREYNQFQCEASNTDFRGQRHTSTVDNHFQVISGTDHDHEHEHDQG